MKKYLLIIILFSAVSAYSGMDDLLISFSTVGPDRYADETQALKGEVYALVWSKGEFAGMNDDFTPADPEDRIILLAPVCAADPETGNMHCPNILFQVDRKIADELDRGYYSVILCDTRGGNGLPTAKYVNSAVTLARGFKFGGKSSSFAGSVSPQFADMAPFEGGKYSESHVESPVITSISIDGTAVKIGCSAMSPVCEWSLLKHDTPCGNGFIADGLAVKTENGFETRKNADTAFFRIAGSRNYPVR